MKTGPHTASQLYCTSVTNSVPMQPRPHKDGEGMGDNLLEMARSVCSSVCRLTICRRFCGGSSGSTDRATASTGGAMGFLGAARFAAACLGAGLPAARVAAAMCSGGMREGRTSKATTRLRLIGHFLWMAKMATEHDVCGRSVGCT